jgi:hypothetical protein
LDGAESLLEVMISRKICTEPCEAYREGHLCVDGLLSEELFFVCCGEILKLFSPVYCSSAATTLLLPRFIGTKLFLDDALLLLLSAATLPTMHPERRDINGVMQRLNATYDELVLGLQHERDEQQREMRRAWDEIEAERAALRRERKQLDDEKARMYMMPAAHPAASPSTYGAASAQRSAAASQRQPQYQPQRSGSTRSATHHDASSLSRASDTADAVGSPFWVTMWRGTHRDGEPHRVHAARCRSLQQLIDRAAKETVCQPAPTVIYTPDGRPITDLSAVRPDGDYLIHPAGFQYHEETVPTRLLEKIVLQATTPAAANSRF